MALSFDGFGRKVDLRPTVFQLFRLLVYCSPFTVLENGNHTSLHTMHLLLQLALAFVVGGPSVVIRLVCNGSEIITINDLVQILSCRALW